MLSHRSPEHALPSSCLAALSDSTSLQECELDVRCNHKQGSHLIWGMTDLKRLAIRVMLDDPTDTWNGAGGE
jgi:hypothetical protein